MQSMSQSKMGIFSLKEKKVTANQSVSKRLTQDDVDLRWIHFFGSFCTETSQHVFFYLLEHQYIDVITPLIF